MTAVQHVGDRRSRPSGQAELPVLQYDINAIRDDFPILKRMARGKQLVYLDNAATTQ